MGNEQGGEFDPSKDGKEPNDNHGNAPYDDIMPKSKKRGQEKKSEVSTAESVSSSNFSSKGDEVKDVSNIPKEYQGTNSPNQFVYSHRGRSNESNESITKCHGDANVRKLNGSYVTNIQLQIL